MSEAIEKNGNIANLGLMVNFDLGLRVGELSALKWSDIDWKNETIFIQRQEVANGKVVEQVKSDSAAGYRELDLSDEAISIFKRIRRDSTILSEYIFCNPDGNRATKIQFVHRLTKAEIALGWKEFKIYPLHTPNSSIPDGRRRGKSGSNTAATGAYRYCNNI